MIGAIGARRADVTYEPLPGSELRDCSTCGHQVVLSPSTVARRPDIVLCHQCAVDVDGLVVIPPTPQAQLDFAELERLRSGQ